VVSVSAVYRLCYLILNRINKPRHGNKEEEDLELKILIPFISGLVSGTLFVFYPREAARGYIGLYLATKSAEYLYNFLDDKGYFAWQPRLLGSWALFPFAFSQLFYSLIFHPDCCSDGFNRIMYTLSDGYRPERPNWLKAGDPWPSKEEVVKSIAEISRAGYP
jgi:hypothetical protein